MSVDVNKIPRSFLHVKTSYSSHLVFDNRWRYPKRTFSPLYPYSTYPSAPPFIIKNCAGSSSHISREKSLKLCMLATWIIAYRYGSLIGPCLKTLLPFSSKPCRFACYHIEIRIILRWFDWAILGGVSVPF